jgi:N-acetylneuraminic acid mutarotase
MLMTLFFLVFLGFFAISDSTLIITQKPSLSLSVARINFATVSAGELVFFAGGCTNVTTCPLSVTDSVEIYNTNTDQWSNATLSVARANLAAATAGDFVLFAGGEYKYFDSLTNTYAYGVFDTVDIYQISTNTWSVATLSQARTRIGATSANGLIFFAGGVTNPVGSLSRSNVVDVFKTSSQTWSTITLSVARSNIAAAASGNIVLFAGGLVSAYTAVRMFEIYNISNQQWQIGHLPNPAPDPGAVSVGRFIFITTGTNYFSGPISDVFYVYDVETNSLTTMYRLRPYVYSTIASTSTGDAVVFGGFTPYPEGFSLVEIYEVSTGNWYYIYNLTHRTGFKIVSSGSKIFFAGGLIDNGKDVTNVMDAVEKTQVIDNSTAPQNPQSPNVPNSPPSPNPTSLNIPSIPYVPTILQNPSLVPQASKSSSLEILNSLLFCIICLFSLM